MVAIQVADSDKMEAWQGLFRVQLFMESGRHFRIGCGPRRGCYMGDLMRFFLLTTSPLSVKCTAHVGLVERPPVMAGRSPQKPTR
jgi:hypothetical protein